MMPLLTYPAVLQLLTQPALGQLLTQPALAQLAWAVRGARPIENRNLQANI
jgi:hypothetical protein